jgi:hypothetical protein
MSSMLHGEYEVYVRLAVDSFADEADKKGAGRRSGVARWGRRFRAVGCCSA